MQQQTWVRTLQRWCFPLSAILDGLVWCGAFFLAVLARLDFELGRVTIPEMLQAATIAAAVQLAAGLITGPYRGRRALASFWDLRLVELVTRS